MKDSFGNANEGDLNKIEKSDPISRGEGESGAIKFCDKTKERIEKRKKKGKEDKESNKG